MAFDRTSVGFLRAELQEVLTKHLAGRKLSVKLDDARFSTSTASFKIDIFESIEDQGSVQCPYWKTHGPAYGLKPEWLGLSCTLNGVKYTLVGFDPKRPKKNIQLRRLNDFKGTIYICKSTQIVARAAELDQALRNKSVDEVIAKLPEALKAISTPPTPPVAGITNAFAKAAKPFGGEW